MLKEIVNYLPVTFKGLLMGSADIIPDVSGGTIAYITGIYETLIASLRSINIHALKKLFRFELRIFWQVINGNFLVSLLSGILLSIFTLSSIIVFLLAHHSLLLFAFFFGLIAASAVVIVKRIHTHTFSHTWPAYRVLYLPL